MSGIMAGEMSQSEVTRENYPDLFELHDQLKAAGVESKPCAFDQYQGPYLYVPSVGKVWYSQQEGEVGFLIERYERGILKFETYGAGYVVPKTLTECRYGVYWTEEAAARIARLARKAGA